MQYVNMKNPQIATADLSQRRVTAAKVPGKVDANGRVAESRLTPEQRKAKEVCTQFEAMMVKEMFTAMQGSTKMFGGGFGGDYFQGMFLDTMAQQAAGQGLGLGKMLYEQIVNANAGANSVQAEKNGATDISGAVSKI